MLGKGAEINEKVLNLAKDKPELLGILKKHMAQKALLERQAVASPEVLVAPLALQPMPVAEPLLPEAPALAFTPLRDALPVVAIGGR